MPKLTLTAGGRAYEIACGEGQEARVKQMGAVVERILADIPITGQIGDAQRMFLAALSLADACEEMKAQQMALTKERTELEKRVNEMEQLPIAPAADDKKPAQAEEMARVIEAAAERVEALSSLLENESD